MIENIVSLLGALITGSIPLVVVKIVYVALLVIFFISIVSWTYRRALCVFDAGWASYSIRNLLRLTFCLIFLLLCVFSTIGLFSPNIKYVSNPYMIFVISINALYTINTLGSSYITQHKKARIITNTFIFASWCISMVALFLLSIKPSELCQSALYETTLADFGIALYRKLNPFFINTNNKFYSIFFTTYINVFNGICVVTLCTFSNIIEKIKNKLFSLKYLIIINSLIIIRDTLFFLLKFTSLSENIIYKNFVGISISLGLLASTFFFIRFIQCEGKYDKNLKKKRVKTIKRDLYEITQDFCGITNVKEYNMCKRRIFNLTRRIKILNIKIDITKLVKIKNPELQNKFLEMVQEALMSEKD